MKRYLKRIIPPLFSLALLFSLIPPISPQAKARDIDNHWAKDVLSWAVDHGYIAGFEDGSIRPDQPITKAQILTVLCRILYAQDSISPSSIGLSGSEWYADAAGKSLALGLIRNASGLSEASITRGEAFYLLSRGFQLDQPGPDPSILAPYPDSRHLQGLVRTSIASRFPPATLRAIAETFTHTKALHELSLPPSCTAFSQTVLPAKTFLQPLRAGLFFQEAAK